MKKILFTFLGLFFFLALAAQTELENRLFDLADVRFTPIKTPDGFEAAYELQIRQPLDHDDPSKGYFYQRAYLTHAGFDRPMVLATEGYHRPSNRMYELTTYTHSNQIDIEHRYFGTSLPDSMDYRYLNLEQATADLHRIRELLGQLYQKPWISTGISKGGQTTIFYRYFYPDDVSVSVPYVAPLNLAAADTRIYDFLAQVGSDDCRKAIYEVQLRLLKNRDKVLPLLHWYAKGAGYQFTYMSLEEAFEYGVLEYPFSFWQMGHDCASIPGKDATLEALIDHFNEVVGLSLYTDEEIAAYGSHYYQAATEMGYYGFDTKPYKGLLKALPPEPNAAFVPARMPVARDYTLPNKTYEWLQEQGDNFLYIYGSTDTWSATMVPPSEKTNSLWFVMKGKHHGSARIANMTSEERSRFFSQLEEWMGMDLVD